MHCLSLSSPPICIYFCICVCLIFCSETLWLYFQENDEVSRANMEVKTKLSHIRSHEVVLDWVRATVRGRSEYTEFTRWGINCCNQSAFCNVGPNFLFQFYDTLTTLHWINGCSSSVIIFLFASNLHKSTYFGLAHFFTSCHLISRPQLQITNRMKGKRSKLQLGRKMYES